MIYKSFLFAKLHKFELFNQVMSIKEKYNGITFNSYLWERYKELTSLKCVWGFEVAHVGMISLLISLHRESWLFFSSLIFFPYNSIVDALEGEKILTWIFSLKKSRLANNQFKL